LAKQIAATSSITPSDGQKRKYLSQTDVPTYSLDKALTVAQAIGDNYGYKPSTPVQVASALEVQPTSSGFRMLIGASVAYGLTKGAYNAAIISIEPLGMRIIRSTEEGDDLKARREALLRPKVIRLFLEKYNGAAFPKDLIAQNVLVDFGVPKEKTAEVLKLIVESANSVGFLQDIKGKKFVDLLSTKAAVTVVGNENDDESQEEEEQPEKSVSAIAPKIPAAGTDAKARRVPLSFTWKTSDGS
jgi:hypothetical protein